MNELSLFSGIGGGLIGTKILGFNLIGTVENDPYCQRVLNARMLDGNLKTCPIFGDIDHFIQSGAAEQYTGFVDVVTAGFPCQPFSEAGQQLGEKDPRNKWPETAHALRIIRPPYALLENVPGLVTSEYFGTILKDLSILGYNTKWAVLSAQNSGAPHIRKRLWVHCTHATSQRPQEMAKVRCNAKKNMANKNQQHTNNRRCLLVRQRIWDNTGMHLLRMVDGLPHRLDRIKACGNGQVPLAVVDAWNTLHT